jgi:hypothetical protein
VHRYREVVARTSAVAAGRRPGRAAGPPVGNVAQPGRIRTLGPFVVLAIPLGLVLVALVVLRLWPCEGTACGEPYLGAWGLVLFAFPTALATGLPWVVSPVNLALTVVTSCGLWVAFGVWAARRATEDVDATWRSFWREVAWYAGGVVLGVIAGLLVLGLGVTLL